MITTIKINKEIKIQFCHNGINFILNPKHEHKTIIIKLTKYTLELLILLLKYRVDLL